MTNYYGIGHDSLANYIAEISGQSGNYALNEDCGIFGPFISSAARTSTSSRGTDNSRAVAVCFRHTSLRSPVSSPAMPDLAGIRAGHWQQPAPRRDGDDTGRSRVRASEVARVDLTGTTGPVNDSYAPRHNPLMYFESIIGKKSCCDSHVLSLSPLAGDSKSVATTPNYSFVTPNTCLDGHDWPKCQDGTPGRLPRVDEFLKTWIPQIMASPAYQQTA